MNKVTSGVLLLLLSLLGSSGWTKEISLADQEHIKVKAVKWREAVSISPNKSDLSFINVFPDSSWWEQFKDPYLSSYIQQAANSNLSLAVARQRIEEANALVKHSFSKEFPQVALGPSASRFRNSATVFRNSRLNNQSYEETSSFALGQAISNFSVPLNIGYMVDIWRKNRNITKVANKQAEATEFDFKAMQVIVTTELANAYFNLLASDQLIALQQEILETAEADLAHSRRLFETGVTDEESVFVSQGRLNDFKARLQDFYQIQALALNQIAVLMGQTPSQVAELKRSDWGQYIIPSEIAAGIPSELIARRPDILAAEKRLSASGFLVEVAKKQMLPSINLTGQFGFATSAISSLFNWESHIKSAASSLVQSIFTGGQGKANLKAHKARYEQLLYSYRDIILQSFREVDDSLASLNAHRNAYSEYESMLESLERRQQIQHNRLQAGAIAPSDINPVKMEVLQAKEGLVQTKLAVLKDVLSLYKALGGGY